MRVIDPWMNADMPEWGDADWMIAVAERYLGSGQDGLRRLEASELLEAMDAHGVERAVLDFNIDRPSQHTLKVIEAAPERLSLSLRVDPRGIMTAVRRVREAHRNLPVVAAKVVPFLQDLPPSHASHYPLYAAGVDLGIPIQINTGVPGPPAAERLPGPDPPRPRLL